MQKFYLILVLVFLSFTPVLGVTIGIQDFETTPATPTLTYTSSGGTTFTGSSAAGDRPANSDFFVSSNTGFGISNGTSTLTFPQSGNIDVSAYSNIAAEFRLASFSINSTGNGADAADYVRIDISPDGGATWYPQIQVNGNNNAWWSYAGGTATASRSYSTSPVTTFAPAGGGGRTTDGYSTVRITNLPAVSTLRLRIILLNNVVNERWIIDDVTITGDLASASLNAAPTSVSGLDYLLGGGPSAPQSFSITGSGLTPSSGVITVTAPANFEMAKAAAGPYATSLDYNYTGGSLASSTVFVRLITGLSVGPYSGNAVVSGGGATPVNVSLNGSVNAAGCGDVFISEYVEGSSNNKCIELYNPTSSPINLASGGYQLRFYFNGNATPGTTINLTGTIAAKGTHVVCNASAGSQFLAVANQTNSSSWYDGNDAVELVKNSGLTTLDIFGRIGENPGSFWEDIPSGNRTQDRTLVRRPSVFEGIVTNPLSMFPTLGSQWVQYNVNENLLLGGHSSVCQNPNNILTGVVSTSTNYCPNAAIKVPFQAIGTYNSGNVFTAQLSDGNGSFSSPQNIGTISLSGTDLSDTILANMPPSVLPTGTNYRVRVISSDPIAQVLLNPNPITAPPSIPNNVTTPSSTSAGGQVTLNWVLPSGCFDEIMVVATAAPGIDFTPTGDGSAYSANPMFSSFNQVVFKGIGTSATITGLNNANIYYFEIFVRLGTNWSSGIEWAAIPDVYCIPSITSTCVPYISRVELDTFVNTSTLGCGIRGFSPYPDKVITLVKGESYTLGVQVGSSSTGQDYRAFYSDDVRAWIDWDRNNAFSNTTEYLLTTPITRNGPSAYATFIVPMTTDTGLTRLRVRLVDNGSTSSCGSTTRGETEDYFIRIINPCSNATIQSFFPTSGGANTEVKISGSNLTGVSNVSFNGVNAEFQVVNDSTLLAKFPPQSGSGRIGLTKSGCATYSSGIFTFLTSSGCSDQYTDLIISEVYSSGLVNYVEIYNGTQTIIDFEKPSNYALRVTNVGTGTPLSQVINLKGVIQPGQTKVFYIRQDGGLANGIQNIAGFEVDAGDTVRLVKNYGTNVDIMVAGAADDFTYRRNNTASAPSLTFNALDWTILSANTSNIGIYVPQIPPFPLDTSNPLDINGCSIDLYAGTSSPALSYEWFYNDNRNNMSNWVSLASSPPAEMAVTGANAQFLSIPKTLNKFNKTQYRVVISNGTCTRFSKSAQFTLQTDSIYRTRQSGSWVDAASWQTAPTTSGPWTNACTYPEESNSLSVRIMEGHTITINDNDSVYCSQITIDSLGRLVLELNSELVIPNRPGVDLIVNGTLEDRANSTGAGEGIVFSGSSTWILGNYGEIIKTNNAPSGKYRSQYDGGITNIPATATWRYRKTTANNPAVVSANMFYPNLYFENFTTGTANLNTTGSYFTGLSSCVVKGNLCIGVTNNPIIVRNEIAGGVMLQVLGDINIGNLSTLINSDGAASPKYGSGFDLKGNLNVAGTFTSNAGDRGRLKLSGNGIQTISGSGTINIDTLIIDKASQTLVKLDRNITVNKLLQFGSGGIIQTDVNEISVLNNSASDAITGFQTPNNTGIYDNDRYVQGKLRRRIAANGTYVFPIGDSIKIVPGDTLGEGYNPVRLVIRTVPTGTPSAVAEFIPVAAPDDIGKLNVYREFICSGATKFLTYTGFTGEGYWKMDGNNFSNYDIYLHPNIANQNNNPNEQSNLGYSNTYRALKEENSKAGAVWNPDVSTAGDPCTVSDTYYEIIGAGYSGFSIFAPGGGAGLTTPLPVELVSFTSTCLENLVELNWSTASEFNSDIFILESSINGLDFSVIGTLRAAGNSNTLKSYQFIDRNPFSPVTYYRLSERDFDGKIHQYGIIAGECERLARAPQVFYVPGEGLVATWEDNRNSDLSIAVYDATGRLMTSKLFGGLEGIRRERISDGITLAQGIYFVGMQQGGQGFGAKVFVP